jgi:hypothetical protein
MPHTPEVAALRSANNAIERTGAKTPRRTRPPFLLYRNMEAREEQQIATAILL